MKRRYTYVALRARPAPLAADSLVDVTYYPPAMPYSYGSVSVSPQYAGVQGAPTYTPSAVQVTARFTQ